jgi:hypothetical protein
MGKYARKAIAAFNKALIAEQFYQFITASKN